MSDQVDSGLLSEEQSDLAGQESSRKAGDSKPDSLAGEALYQAALQDKVAAERLRRHFQSDKDRGVKEAKETANKALQEVERIARNLGVEPEKVIEAQRKMVLDDLVAERRGISSELPDSERELPETQRAASSVVLPTAFKEAGWELKDVTTEDMEFARQHKDKAALVNALFERRISGPRPTTSVTGASLTQPGGSGGSNAEPGTEELTKNYTTEMAAARGNASEVKRLKQHYRTLGVDVDNIGFT